MRHTLFIGAFLFAASFAASADTAPTGGTPDQIVQQTAQDLFAAVNSNKAELQKDPQQLYELVGKILLPHFDFEMASRLVLGQAWR
ncbi:MAG TPA: ABC transporter substrate-binding protein, partial [Gammaproteobacteria bacterium]|nr:ABC transporter substrate-binding protein [Gammaproteobacteria bacterium]